MKIAFLDLEGTLVKSESWNKVKIKFGAKKLSDEYDKLYAEGKVGYEEWRRELVKIWKKNSWYLYFYKLFLNFFLKPSLLHKKKS